MIISRTPYRISLFGGGTDYPTWFNKNKGHVISTSIDKYIYISCRYLPPFFDHSIRIVYSKNEEVKKVEDLKHPSVKEVLKYLNIKNNLELHYNGDLPSKSGIGSSSAFTVGILNSLSKYKNINLSKRKLAEKSIFIEQKKIKEVVGSQDQIGVSYGGLNHIKFFNKDSFSVNKIKLRKRKLHNLENNLMLFHTGIFRTAENISKKYIKDLRKNERYLINIYDLVFEALKLIRSGQNDLLGRLLDETWNLKRQMSNHITNFVIDDIYKTGLSNGAYGGKLLGAGGGGFILLYVPLKNQKKVRRALNKLLFVPFKFENQGSQIIYSNSQQRYLLEEK